MPLIDYSNISTYNITSLKDVDSLNDMFLAVNKLLGIDYLFGITSLLVFFIVVMLVYRDYDYRVGLIISSTLTLFVALFYYFAKLILWQHLLIVFAVFLLSLLISWKWSE